MKKSYNISEAIKLIATFCVPLGGCYAEDVDIDPIISTFVQNGNASLEEEYGDKYLVNDAGQNLLKPFAEKIAIDFIKFMKPASVLRPIAEIMRWFADKYELDADTAEAIADYFCHMLDRFNDEYAIFHAINSKCASGYYIEKIDMH